MRSTSMGANGEDVLLSEEARSVLPLSLECKCVERLNVWESLRQAASNCPSGATPCLVFSKNRSPSYAVLPLEEVLRLYAVASQGGEGEKKKRIPPRAERLIRKLHDMVVNRSKSSSSEDSAGSTSDA